VNYDDSPDRDEAGNGLTLFPLINQSLGTPKLLDWMMSPSDKVALIFLLEHLRPKVAIEIGTRYGGSLQVLSQFCHRVYSIDVDPDIPRRLEGKFPNVEYLIGPSDQLLPSLIDRLAEEGAELSFALLLTATTQQREFERILIISFDFALLLHCISLCTTALIRNAVLV